MKSHRNILFILLTILTSKNVSAQAKELSLQEARLVKTYSKLSSFIQENYDSINFYSAKFTDQFSKFITANPATLNYPFKKLIDSNFCQIKTSTDGNFKVYSWDKWTGGTMHEYGIIFQWRSNGRVFTKVPTYLDNDPGSFVSNIFFVNVNNNPIYLVVTNGTYSTKDASQSVSVYTINNNKLVDTVKLFNTKTQKLNRIDVDYDFFSVVDRPERPIELIKYNDKTKVISISVVDEKGKVMNRNIHYQLKGKYFEYVGIAGK